MKSNKLFFVLLLTIFTGRNLSAQITFEKNIGGAGDDEGVFVKQTNDNGYIIGAYNLSYGNFIIKTDSVGDTLWIRTIGVKSWGGGCIIAETYDNGYAIVTDIPDNNGGGTNDIYLIRMKANGDTIWTKSFGGVSNDRASYILQTIDSGFIFGGFTVNFGAGSSDYYLIETDLNGNIVWTRTYGGAATENLYSICQAKDGGYILVGYTESFGAGNWDVYLVRTNSNGDTLWTRTFGGPGLDYGTSVQQTTDSGFIVVGNISRLPSWNDIYLIKLNVNGDTLWTKTFGGGVVFNRGYSVQQTIDSGYVVVGYTNDGAIIIKTNENGDTLWTKSGIGSNMNSAAYYVQQTRDSGYVIVGNFGGIGIGVSSVCLIKTDANGNSGCGSSVNTQIIIDSIQTIVSRPNTIVSSGGIMSSNHIPIGNIIGGTVTTLCSSVGINETYNDNLISISPNPFTTELSLSGTKENGLALIFDITGKEILHQITSEDETKINTSYLKNGFYFLNYLNLVENKRTNAKLVKL